MGTPFALMLLAVIAGAAVAIQGAANAALADRITLPNTLIVNTLVVLLGTIAYYLWTRLNPMSVTKSIFSSDGVFGDGAHWSQYVGGACGFVVIGVVAYAFPRLGAAWTVGLLVLGQGVAALAVDHFGLYGIASAAITPVRILGVALIAAGVFLVRK